MLKEIEKYIHYIHRAATPIPLDPVQVSLYWLKEHNPIPVYSGIVDGTYSQVGEVRSVVMNVLARHVFAYSRASSTSKRSWGRMPH